MGSCFSIPILGGAAKEKDEMKQVRIPEMAGTSNHSVTEDNRVIYQPLHPSVRPLLDPEYVLFHDKYAQYVQPEHLNPWDKSLRTRYTWPYAGSPIVEVGNVKDIRPCPNFNIRVFTPAGDPPTDTNGWPLLIWFHGGAFVVGNIHSDNDLCALACRDVGCVVANIDYRLAPEDAFPAAIDDIADVLRWVNSDAGASHLRVDRTRIGIGGASAGGNLAAVGALLAIKMNMPVALQVLVVPVTDNTATLDTIWSEHPHAPWLTAPRMTWYRNLYLEDKQDAHGWRASPIFAPKEMLAKLPKTWIAIAEQDMLSTEGLAYGKLLKELGVNTHVEIYEGMPHGMMALSGVLKTGRRAMKDVVDVLRRTFNESSAAV